MNYWVPKKVISGGQAGADCAGLVGAERAGVPTGGVAPAGWRTEKGPQPEALRDRFGLTEHSSSAYPPRTEENVVNSNATVIYSSNANSPGTVQTVNFCVKHSKPYLMVNPFSEDAIMLTRSFLLHERPMVLNIAGNRESKSKGISVQVAKIVHVVLSGD